mgnify:CR=1 FL=1
MKIRVTSDKSLTLTAENSDESIKKLVANKLLDAWWREAKEFLEEVSVTMRRLEPGQSVLVTSKSIVVTLEKPATPASDASK